MGNIFAKDVMEMNNDVLHQEVRPLGKLIEFLKASKHGGYPVTVSRDDPTLLGYVHTEPLLKYLQKVLEETVHIVQTEPLLKYLQKEKEENPFCTYQTKVGFNKFMSTKPTDALDVSEYVDQGVIVVTPEAPATQLQQIFQNLGVMVILVRERASLVGMLTKKAFINLSLADGSSSCRPDCGSCTHGLSITFTRLMRTPTVKIFAKDVMEMNNDVLHQEVRPLGKLIEFLKASKHGGYPVTVSRDDPTLLGYVHAEPLLKYLQKVLEETVHIVQTEPLLKYLQKEKEENPFCTYQTKVGFNKFMSTKPTGALDVSEYVDQGVIVVTPEAP